MWGNDAVKRASLLGCGLLAACCAGCLHTSLDTVEAPGPSLTGAWKLDPAASDDPQKVIDHMRAEAKAKIARMREAPVMTQQPGRPGHPGGGAAGGSGRDSGAGDSPAEGYDIGAPPGNGPRPDPLRYSPMYHVLTNELARGDFLTVRESPGEFVLDYGTSVRRFTPGLRSVVSAENGVGDQESGWDKHEYVITLKAQQGPDVVQRFSLSADGKRLIEKLAIGPAELAQVNLTRVYEHTTEQAPHKLPIND